MRTELWSAALLVASLASCSDNSAAPVDTSSDALPVPQPTVTVTVSASPSEQTSQPSDAPAPQPAVRDAQGCLTLQLPGHFEGDGLAKHFVPGPAVKQCNPQPIAASPALPYVPPTASTPGN